MKSVLKIFVLLISIGLFLPVFVFAQSPGIPHQFFGTVHFASGATPNGLSVEAKINSVVVGSSVTANGNYGYSPNLLFVTDSQNTNAGKTIEFYVSGVKANETAIFANGASTPLNLTIPASSDSGSTTTSGGDTTSGGSTSSGGGGGGGGAAATVTTILSAVAQKVDANKDGKIDVLDFNSLMVNWGKTGTGNIADFNGDGKVDIFDFNLLMINWTK